MKISCFCFVWLKAILISGAFVGIFHLFYVFNALKKYDFPTNEWYMLGLRLEITKNKLDEIEGIHADVSRCLIECLYYWFCNGGFYDMFNSPPIWRSLLVALIGNGNYLTAEQLIDHGKSMCAVGKFRGSKVSHFVSFFHIQKILCGILFCG